MFFEGLLGGGLEGANGSKIANTTTKGMMGNGT
jgi:hypothetical protein